MLVAKAGPSSRKVITLIKLLPVSQRLDRNRVPEISTIIGKTINSIPSLTSDNKPGSELYVNYLNDTFQINRSLKQSLKLLISLDKNNAIDLASKIERKEIRVMADMLIQFDSVDSLLALPK